MDRVQSKAAWLGAVVSAIFLMTTSWAPIAQAGMIGTAQVVHESQVAQQRARIQSMLERQDVQAKLQELGVDPARVQQRVAALSDQEVQQLSQRMDDMPAGAGIIETTLVLGVFVFLVLLVTDILGYTDVFPFVQKTVH